MCRLLQTAARNKVMESGYGCCCSLGEERGPGLGLQTAAAGCPRGVQLNGECELD